MKRKKVVRNVTMATVATGLVQLSGAGAAGAGPQSPAALCSSTFGEQGPAGGQIVGEGPPGDLMTVTLGWEAGDWPNGLREVVTCLSIDGKAAPGMTRLTAQPPNAGNIAVDLMLPPGPAGSLVCQNSILIGKGATEGQQRQTGPVCFKLRAAEELLAGPETASGTTTAPAAGGDVLLRVPTTHPSSPAVSAPAPMPSSTPPARAAFEAARGAAKSPTAWRATPVRTDPAPAAAPAPVRSAPVTRAGQAANELARTPSRPVQSDAPSGAVASPRSARTGAVAAAAPGAPGAQITNAPRSGLPRTGVGDKIPLAAAGSLMALGGAAIILGEPRRRTARRFA